MKKRVPDFDVLHDSVLRTTDFAAWPDHAIFYFDALDGHRYALDVETVLSFTYERRSPHNQGMDAWAEISQDERAAEWAHWLRQQTSGNQRNVYRVEVSTSSSAIVIYCVGWQTGRIGVDVPYVCVWGQGRDGRRGARARPSHGRSRAQ